MNTEAVEELKGALGEARETMAHAANLIAKIEGDIVEAENGEGIWAPIEEEDDA